MSKNLEGFGLEPQVINAAFQEMKIDVEYRFLPPARAFENSKSGEIEGAVGWVYTDERLQWFYYSDELIKAPLLFFHLKSFNFNWTTMEDLKNIPIGVVLKNHYGDEFQKALDDQKLKIYKVGKDELLFRMLQNKNIKLLPANLYVGYGFINKMFDKKSAQQFTHHPRPIKISVYHVLFSKKVLENEKTVKLFNQGLREIKENGTYDKIVRKFLME
ncbi:MAG: transporter substrate-binding domain-containing protein [Desulfobacteraceae bacterium]|nr:transporter substrate-binding domain-containing protein [Desulfobacteraceae bacterium]